MTADITRLEHLRGNAQAALTMTRHLVDKYAEALSHKDLESVRRSMEQIEALLTKGGMPQIDEALGLLDEIRERIITVPALSRSAR